jgi:hypothetical protein
MMEFLRQRAFIDFLKESTFAVNDVIQKSWIVTKSHYMYIAVISFLMFLTWSCVDFLTYYLKESDFFLGFVICLVLVLIYFIVYLFLFNFILKAIDDSSNVEELSLSSFFPTKKQILNYFIGTLIFAAMIFILALLVFCITVPLIYLRVRYELVLNIGLSVEYLILFIAFVRISFFPFFILEHNAGSYSSLKMSLAITRGNLTRLLLLLICLAFSGAVYGYLRGTEFYIPGKIYLILLVMAFISFVIVPFTTVALTIAYRQMMSDYKGEEHPDIIHNIV